MRKTAALLTGALCAATAAADFLPACPWAPYENTVRVWGQVTDLITPGDGGSVTAFTLRSWTGWEARYDCAGPSVGCDMIRRGDSILVNGHVEDVLSCRWDGIDYILVPNVIYRCQGHTPGTCLQLTPCS